MKQPTLDTLSAEQRLDQLYELAKRAPSPDSGRYRVQAAQVLMEMNRLSEAAAILSAIASNNIPPEIRTQYMLASAELALYEFDPQRVLDILDTTRPDVTQAITDTPINIRVGQLRAQAFDLMNNDFASAKELIHIAPMMPSNSAKWNKEQIWQSLKRISETEFSRIAHANYETEVRGWLSLVALSRANQDDLDRQLQALSQWLQIWPTHYAAQNLPDELALLSTMITNRPKKVSLLLPLSGKNEVAGNAILNGFMAAYYASLERGSYTPEIQVLDTGQGATAQALYDQAEKDGSDFVIGPLDKEQVQSIQLNAEVPIATLALNYGNEALATDNLFQFGLAAEDEARQAADFARQQGHSNALIIAPDGPWGTRISNAFTAEWLANEGVVLETQMFSRDQSYASTIKQLLNIDDSEARKQRVKQITNRNIESVARRRTDVDFIFVIATPQQARQIKPTLAFYFAGKLPVIATSHIFSGDQDNDLNRDLDGVVFCETPWMLGDRDNVLKENIQKAWPGSSERLGRLYALGVDSYRLLPRVTQMAAMPSATVSGATGVLSVDAQGRVVRSLLWAKIQNGAIRKL